MVAQKYRWDFIGLSTDEKPTAETSPKVTDGSTYYCSDTSQLYVWCNDQWYEKTATGGGGGGDAPTVVQATGTSTTDVMSQNAVSSMVFADPGTDTKIEIGAGASASNAAKAIAVGAGSGARNTGAVALGWSAGASGIGQVALGAASGSNDTTPGVMFIGPTNEYYGYNNTRYRLLTGLYDGQSAHDAVTVGQVNSVIDAINTALSTNIPHIGA